MASKLICLEAENLIIEQEVSSASLYKVRYTHPTWPEGASGVTVGIGVDIGYCNHDELEHSWHGRIPDSMISLLHLGVGLKGEAAHALVRSGKLNAVTVPWEVALAEFEEVEIPVWLSKTRKTYPGLERLGPYCEGSLVSLCFNRGTQLTDKPGENRRVEMRRIRDHLAAGQPEMVPGELRAMKRLWHNGLVGRRETEARLFEKGLALSRAA